jgi:hypothetical protein
LKISHQTFVTYLSVLLLVDGADVAVAAVHAFSKTPILAADGFKVNVQDDLAIVRLRYEEVVLPF